MPALFWIESQVALAKTMPSASILFASSISKVDLTKLQI